MKKLINGKYIEMTDDEIAQSYIGLDEAETEYWENISYDDAVNAEIRKKYTESQEFSILRQRDEKPEEYAEYFAYCEECKAYVKGKKGM